MADINAEVVGGAPKAGRNRIRDSKLELKEFKLKVRLEDDFYARAHFQEFFRRPFTQIVIILAAVLLLQSLLAGSFTNPEVSIVNKVGVVLMVLLCFVVMPLLAKNRWPHMKESNDFWLNDQRYILNTKGLTANSKHGEHRLQWRELRRIFETKEAIVFVVYRFHLVALPLTDFSDDEKQQIRDIIFYCTRNLRLNPKLKGKRR